MRKLDKDTSRIYEQQYMQQELDRIHQRDSVPKIMGQRHFETDVKPNVRKYQRSNNNSYDYDNDDMNPMAMLNNHKKNMD